MTAKNSTRLTKSSRKHIRQEKGRIRKMPFGMAERAQKIAELYGKFGVTR